MHHRILGKTALKVSPICIGGWQLAGPLCFDGKPDGHPDPGRDYVIHMIRTLHDEGLNCIDTAEQYGAGESERRIGEAIRGCRDEWIVSTKFGFRVGPKGERNDSSAPDTIAPSLEGSLNRLKTDYVDIYLYHCPPEPDELERGKEVLEKLVRQGKCRFYGISTNDIECIRNMADRNMLQVVQYAANILWEQPTIDSIARSCGAGTQLRGVMAQGRLSGKYFHQKTHWQQDDNRTHMTGGDDFSRYAVLEECLPEGMTMVQLALRWNLDDADHHTICLGAKTVEEYRHAIKAVEMPPLSDEVRRAVRDQVQKL